MAWSKRSSKLSEPKEKISVQQPRARSLVMKLFVRPTNSPNTQRGTFLQPKPNGGANTMTRRKLDLESFRNSAYETYRRIQIR